ncbi:MAG: Clp1/GlmU family protein [Nitrososphaerota archaeon]
MAENRQFLKRENTLLLGGPASARVVDGEVEVFGHRPKKGETLISRPWRVLPIHALTDTVLELSLGAGHSLRIVEEDTIPDSWRSLSERIGINSRVMVIGGVDSGKTSLVTFLHNQAVKKGIPTIIFDLDIGQSDICPPTTMANSGLYFKTVPSLHLIRPDKIYPVGYTSPSYNPKEALDKARLLLKEGEKRCVLINTDGWVGEGAADWYKASLVDSAIPSHVVLLGAESGPLLNDAIAKSGAEVIKLDVPKMVSPRNHEARRLIREMNYARFLRGASLKTIPLSWISFKILEQEGENYPSITDYLNDVVLDIEKCGCAASKKIIGHEGYDLSDIGIGLISYVLSENDTVSSIALFMGIDPKKQIARIYTPYNDTIKRIAIGGVILSSTFEELHVYRQRV